MNDPFTRRTAMQTVSAAALATSVPASLWPSLACAAEQLVATRPVPQSGEPIPIVGIGTFVVFDFENDPAAFAERRQVIQNLIAGGGKFIDTAARYAKAEARLGDLVADLGVRDKLFIATKTWAEDSYEGRRASALISLQTLRMDPVDLMQYHVVERADTDFGFLREFQAAGHTRYIGFSNSRNYEAMEACLVREKLPFFQVDYSLDNRDAEDRLLPAAKDVGAAVIINVPFGHGRLFPRVAGRPLPDFAAEFGATSWAQFFLKFVLSHPSVTVVIPGTDKPEYMLDNLAAGRGPMPDAATRRRMVEFWESLPG